jgi:hypothetical protein
MDVKKEEATVDEPQVKKFEIIRSTLPKKQK